MNNTHPSPHVYVLGAMREPTGAYQISAAQGPLTEAEREAQPQRREGRRAHASDYVDRAQQRRSGVRCHGQQHITLTGEDLVEAERLVHERIREGEATFRRTLRKKCSSITELAAVRPQAAAEDAIKEL